MTDVYDRYNYLMKNEEKFLKLYPIVAKYMCLNEYSQTAFNKILKKQREYNVRSLQEKLSEESGLREYFENQALYAKYLHEEKFVSKKKCEKIYTETLNELLMHRKESEEITKSHIQERTDILKKELKILSD
jgi:hypothetical protein